MSAAKQNAQRELGAGAAENKLQGNNTTVSEAVCHG